jgi:hypothetical protein
MDRLMMFSSFGALGLSASHDMSTPGEIPGGFDLAVFLSCPASSGPLG